MLMLRLLFLGWCSLLLPMAGTAANIVPPDDPRQSITYWKPHSLSPDQDADVGLALTVFDNLLRSWDDARVAPNLFVVTSDAGPWAASLADGNILLSKSAIDICLRYGRDKAAHLLAFVLAHELAHQRADDLWHHKFFRLAGAQTPQVQRQMLRGLSADDMVDLERREAQADHDGLIMMATVGYDPYQVLDGKDFFTVWAESLWGGQCGDGNQGVPQQACQQAQSRATRAAVQLQKVAQQATLYEMGIQQLIAGNLEMARRYLRAFGRDYPSREVYSSIGASYFLEALRLQQRMVEEGLLTQPAFFYPLLLDAHPVVPGDSGGKRGNRQQLRRQLSEQRGALLRKAVDAYEKAQQLAPEHPGAYFMAALCYLLDANTYMTRGVLQGKYISRFGKDAAIDMLLAMTGALEGDMAQALRAQERIVKAIEDQGYPKTMLPRTLYAYTAYYNLAVLLDTAGRGKEKSTLWQRLAQRSQRAGDSVLFRLALAQLQPASGQHADLGNEYTAFEDTDDFFPQDKTMPVIQQEFWLEGEQLVLKRFLNGTRVVTGPGGRVLATWHDPGAPGTGLPLAIGDRDDRPLKLFGMPRRQMHLTSGEYLVFEQLGLVIQLDNGRVTGWFRYLKEDAG